MRSSTGPAPKAPCLKHGSCSSGVEGSTQTADALFGLGRGSSRAGADAVAAAAAAERVGVERVVRGILQYSQALGDRFVKLTRFRERKEEAASLRYKFRDISIINGSIICAKFRSMDWIAILPRIFYIGNSKPVCLSPRHQEIPTIAISGPEPLPTVTCIPCELIADTPVVGLTFGLNGALFSYAAQPHPRDNRL